jgi:predicted dinucleotide-binding enzyme
VTKTVEEFPVNIAVIGGGGVGETLAKAWARRGHAVAFGVRDPGSDKSKKLASSSGIAVKTNREAAAAAQVIVLPLRGKQRARPSGLAAISPERSSSIAPTR